MQVKTLERTPNPEELAFRAGRNDYSDEWIGNKTTEELLEDCSSDTIPEFLYRALERGHHGIFEHPSISLSFEGVSRVTMSQVTRHRHMSFDVKSLRYAKFGKGEWDVHQDMYNPESIKELDDGEHGEYQWELCNAVEKYNHLLDEGVPKDEARYALPLATKVNVVMSGNLRSMLHFLDLRHAADVQNETIEYAKLVAQELEDWCPNVHEYYMDNMDQRENRLAP